MSRRVLALLIGCLLILTACSEDERRELRLTRTSTVDTGVRVLADNCPGPSSVSLLVRDDVLWEVQAPADPIDDPASESTAGLIEFLVGQTPEGWETVTPLTERVEPGTRYTVRTQPDGQTIDFSTPDLQAGLLWDGTGVIQFNPNLIDLECGTSTDVGLFATNIAILAALGVATAALVLVALILLLFVVTSRFSRVRSIQKKAMSEAEASRPAED